MLLVFYNVIHIMKGNRAQEVRRTLFDNSRLVTPNVEHIPRSKKLPTLLI